MRIIKPTELKTFPVNLWLKQWLLLTAGDYENFNAMTVAWGSIGGMWKKPFVQIVVRPSRYTFQFLEKYPTFTLCAFSADYKKALSLLGSKSGRDSHKIEESGLTPIKAQTVAAPAYSEAELILECRKTYAQDMDPNSFIDQTIAENYTQNDYHRIYFGAIESISIKD